MFKLKRHPDNPVLLPDLGSDWECYNVFNPAVVYEGGLFRMWYRAQGLDWVSRIGYAVSEDGVSWNRLRRPVLEPHDGTDSRGVEDPRVVVLDDGSTPTPVYTMTYTAYGREFLPGAAGDQPTHAGGGILPMLARSTNGITWTRLGPIVRGEDNKDHVLFPRRIHGRYAALHRRWPRIWIAYSDDLITWREEDMGVVFGPRPGNDWDQKSVGANGVPIETEHGWLTFYHGYGETRSGEHVYHLGACLLDLDDPARVLRRPKAPILWPEELWELRGDVPNVVFSCANVVVNDTIYVYYGGGDHVIALATAKLGDVLAFVLHAP
jgi:predicted GH43/DUF377 family glycosyl hydrolase